MRRDAWHDSCPDCPELMCRLSRLELLAQICILGLNPDAARPLARLMSRLSRPYVQTFQTQTVGENLQFETKSGCGATLGTILVQTVQNLCADFQHSNSWREWAIWVQIRMQRDLDATHFHTFQIFCLDFPDSNTRCGATLGGFLSRLFRPYDKIFRAETLGATLQFGSKSGSGATLGAIFL